jgi:hypothetical protein
MRLSLEPPYLIVKPGVSEEEFYRLADEDSDWEYLDVLQKLIPPGQNAAFGHNQILATDSTNFTKSKFGSVKFV